MFNFILPNAHPPPPPLLHLLSMLSSVNLLFIPAEKWEYWIALYNLYPWTASFTYRVHFMVQNCIILFSFTVGHPVNHMKGKVWVENSLYTLYIHYKFVIYIRQWANNVWDNKPHVLANKLQCIRKCAQLH